MSYKQKAFEVAKSFNATYDVVEYYDDEHWNVDFYAPTGKRWVANSEHATMQRESKLTDCWKDAIATMKLGLEDCDCYDCK
jgi:hypothetical protein